jgi:hypothetical protein
MEEWKDVVGYEGRYQVSDIGRVRSVPRKENRNMDIILSPYQGQYPAVNLRKEGNSRTTPIHRIVAEAFIENPDKKRTINHKDGDKYNNCVNNLEWATDSENNQHAFNTGLRKPRSAKMKIVAIKDMAIIEFGSVRECARELGVVTRTVRQAYSIPCRCKGYQIYNYE